MSKKKPKKHLVRIDIGLKKGLLNRYSFRFWSTDIHLSIYKNGACVRYSMASIPKKVSFDLRKTEIVKKALFLLLIETGHCNELYNAKLFFNGKREAEEDFYFLK